MVCSSVLHTQTSIELVLPWQSIQPCRTNGVVGFFFKPVTFATMLFLGYCVAMRVAEHSINLPCYTNAHTEGEMHFPSACILGPVDLPLILKFKPTVSLYNEPLRAYKLLTFHFHAGSSSRAPASRCL